MLHVCTVLARNKWQIWQFIINLSKFYPPIVFFLADLLYTAVNLPMLFLPKCIWAAIHHSVLWPNVFAIPVPMLYTVQQVFDGYIFHEIVLRGRMFMNHQEYLAGNSSTIAVGYLIIILCSYYFIFGCVFSHSCLSTGLVSAFCYFSFSIQLQRWK